jgi:hypothetical protein
MRDPVAEPICSTFTGAAAVGLEFFDLMVERGHDRSLLIEGQIRNIGRSSQLVPSIHLKVFDVSGASILERDYGLREDVVLAVGDSINVRCRLQNVPDDVVDLDLEFVQHMAE